MYVTYSALREPDEHRIVDTRGPRWSPLSSPFVLLSSIAGMARDRVFSATTVHHLHIAGRGSTARKLILGAVARTLGCTHIIHLHDFDYASDFDRRPPWLKRAISRLFAGADRVVVLGLRDQETVVRRLGVPKASVTILHNAVPDPGARSSDRTSDPVAIVFLGQLGPRKGVPDLLEALADPAMADLKWTAVLAGDGPVDFYRAETARLGLSDRVTLPGWLGREQVTALCKRSDILVLPSQGEGMAMAVLEGLAHGLAVVTTQFGAHEEVLRDGETCLFVPVGDPPALAQALARLVTHPQQISELAQAGRHHFITSLSIGAYMDSLNAVYDDLDQRGTTAGAITRGAA